LGKKRSVKPDAIALTSGLTGTLKRRLKFPVGAIASRVEAQVRFFLAVEQTPPPVGKLYRADITAHYKYLKRTWPVSASSWSELAIRSL
jgi:hypothetical protein